MKSFFSKLVQNKLAVIAIVAMLGLVGLSISSYSDSSKVSAAGDCDSNAIIYCGAFTSGSLASKYANLDAKGKAAFAHAGVDPSKFGQTVMGSITRDNKVIVGGKVVGTSAYTYGRGYMPGSAQISGGAYMRHPSVSFRQASIPAFVYMENGVFKWAVITTCGNPVKATPSTPTPRPSQQIQKKVSTDLKLSTDAAYFYGAESVKVAPGTTVRFITMATNTGNTNLSGGVLDTIPSGTSFVKGTYQLKEKGKIVKTGAIGKAGTNVYGWIGTLKPGAEVKIDIWVKYNTTKKVRNIACIDTNELPKLCDDAYVESEPQAGCVSLNATKVNRNTYKFEGKGSVRDGAKIEAYYFKPSLTPSIPSKIVRTGNTSASTTYTYQNPGTYTAQLTLDTNIGNRSGEQCKVQIKIEAPNAVCDDLSADSVDRLTRRLTVASTVTNGATIDGYTFDFGDGRREETEAPVATHTYEPGSYNAKVTVHTSVGDKTSPECEIKIQIADQDEPALDVEKRVTADLSLGADERGYDKAKELVEVDPGAIVKFIIKLTNIGNIALEDVQLKDVLPEGLSLQDGELERTIQKIEPGESAYFEVTATTSESIGNSTVTNVVCVVHDTDEDGNVELECSPEDCPKNPDIEKGEDLKDCDDAKVRINTPGTPSTLPRTGIESVVSGVGGLGMVIVAARSWVVSRRRLLMAHLTRD